LGIVVEDIDRRLIPRWRNSAALGSGAELASLKSGPVAVSTEAFIAKLDEWQRDRSLGVAVDLLTSAVALSRHDQAREAADFVLKNAARVSDAVLRIAHQVAGSSSAVTKPQATSENLDELVSIVRRDIHQLRQLLQDHPRDALAWSDMARAYATIGQVDRALHAMEMARRLAPSSRPILRSASRLLVRAGAPDEAQTLLQRSDRTRHDPWLMCQFCRH
jgi:cytochrome c-type biogenesis protein CcmH/NrfG